MNKSEKLLKFQEHHDFEDTVLRFFGEVREEVVLSKLHATKYIAKWTFYDGSIVYLIDDHFTDELNGDTMPYT